LYSLNINDGSVLCGCRSYCFNRGFSKHNNGKQKKKGKKDKKIKKIGVFEEFFEKWGGWQGLKERFYRTYLFSG
jgi:hypothetical protein